ncbi:O-antigen polymerase [Croceibacterium ferulae]|uniref:O-antigen polymerase n=1 Tax=Croceibacterium ferulae TaxID=1854641 RepID=UPI000EAF410B|nr:O-antigen polymerase [Croceibacterium ferulae]
MYEFMLAVTVVIFLAACAWYLRHPASSFYHPMTYYLAFHGVVFTVRPIFSQIYEYRTLYDAIGFQPTEWDRSAALICANLALLSFGAVCMALANQPVSFSQSASHTDRRMPLLRAYWLIAAILAVLGLWSILSAMGTAATTDINEFRKIDARTGAGYLVGANGYFINLALLLAPIVAIIPYLARFKWWSLLPFACYAVLKLASGGRGQVVTAAVIIGMLYMLDQRRRWPSLAILPALAAGWLVFAAIGDDRGAGIRTTIGVEEQSVVVSSKRELKPLETMDLANMEFLEMLIWAIPERTGTYNYFVHNLQIFTEPIPRALWPGKPVGPPIQMYELYRYSQPLGATASIAGAGWAAAGYVGVIIWAGLFGAIFGWAYRAYVRGNGGIAATVAYMTMAAISPIMYRDGSIMSILKVVQFYYIPIIALALVSYYLAHNARSASGSGGSTGPIGPTSARHRRRLHASGASAVPPAPEPHLAGQVMPATPRSRRIARMHGHG